jgi:hypothetical protein
MKENNDILDALKKRKKPEVPNGFFENFSDSLISNLSEKTEVEDLSKSDKVNVPEGFFENFSSNLMEKIEAEEKKPTRIISLRFISYAAAIAATLLIMFTILPNDENSVANNEIETETVDEFSDEDYLAFIDEDEMIDFIVENEDIEIEESTDEEEEDVFYLLEEDLEDIYLEL